MSSVRLPLLLATLALMPCACGNGETSEGTERREAPREPDLPTVPVTATVELVPPVEGETVTIAIAAYPVGTDVEDGPMFGVAPIFVWGSGPLPTTDGVSFATALPSGVPMIVFVDEDGDGRALPAARFSAPYTVDGDAAAPSLAIVIDRIFEPAPGADGPGDPSKAPPDGPEPRGPDGGPGNPDGPPGPDGRDPEAPIVPGLGVAPDGAELAERTVSVTLLEGVTAKTGTVLVIGHPKGTLSTGEPPGGRPVYSWVSEPPIGDWPIELAVPLPSKLDLIVFVDQNGDLFPGPTDLLSDAMPKFNPPGAGQTLVVEVGPATQPDEVRGGEDEENPIEEAPVTEGLDSAGTFLLLLDSHPRVPFLRTGTVMVVSYRNDQIDRGVPKSGARPSFFWRSDQLQLVWPLEIHAPLPKAASQTLYMVLDLDGDSLPSPGDLSSEPRKDWTPPGEGEKVSFIFERAFGLAQGGTDEGEEDPEE